MRHIPEDELHAYLDQALSRPQCVEIESHLATCDACQSTRDGIAALRDRTTALLATLAPPRRFTPALDILREQAADRTARRQHRRSTAVWAASVVAALGLGWWAHTFSVPAPMLAAKPPVSHPAPSAALGAPSTDAGVAQESTVRNASATVGSHGTLAPDGHVVTADGHLVAAPALTQPPRVEISTLQLPTGDFETSLSGIWRTLSWAGARDERGDSVPHIDGLPVVEVQVGQTKTGDNKSIMVVAQQLASGEVIRTIEGPAADVSQLLAGRSGMSAPSPWPTAESPGIAGGDGAMAMRHGDRMLAIAAQLPNDSLRAMMRRLNAEMRGK